jgi:hypothetical protein
MEIFEMPSDRLSEIYSDLTCDGCSTKLQASPVTVWAKAGCGYFCAACLGGGVHLTHPASQPR